MNSRFGLWVAVVGTFGTGAAIVFYLAEIIIGSREAMGLLVVLAVTGGCYLFDRIDRLERRVESLNDKLSLTKALVDELARRQSR